MIETIRGLVRPVVTFLFAMVLSIIICYLVFRFADKEMAKVVLNDFMVLVASIISFWFASRVKEK
jgi:hypothetical protein